MTFNLTIQLKESTKFPNEMLEIQLQFVVFVPHNFNFLKAANNSNSAVIGIVVFLLVLAAVVSIVWKLKAAKNKGICISCIKSFDNYSDNDNEKEFIATWLKYH